MNTSDTRRFGGISRLFGPQGFEKLACSHVTIVGVGGVGSWVAEAIARTAVGKITIVDGDTVEESNTNRQMPAFDGNYGRLKVDVLAERLKAINPNAQVRAVPLFIKENNVDELIEPCDVVIDCIDSLSAKALLLAKAKEKASVVLTSGGAGGKVDASMVEAADIADVQGDALIAALRSQLRKKYGFAKGLASGKKSPSMGITAVFSREPVRVSQDGAEGFGVFMAVTATFAMRLVQLAVEAILNEANEG